MTTLTDKELIKEIKERIGSLDVRDNIERRAYEIALASLEAKPIGAFHIAEQQVDGTSDYLKDGEWPIDNGIIEVYAAPPVPVVPEEKPMPNALSMLEREITQLIGDAQEATVTGYELIAEAWRLMDGQDPKTSDWHSKASKYLNSNIVEKVDDDRIDAIKAVLRRLAGNYPVTPDGWISCSERMPKKNQNVLISVNFDSDLVEPLICSARYTGSTFRRGQATIKPGNGIEQATHWMPLPEPPQEVNQ
ncbi:hypothetical protein A8M40_22715 [Escherichia coli]|uniref:DUF551 domain-containing protein n=2 Tax=Escherichia coli TaxID=562 RepID=UPI0003BE6FCA|nr:DUF551 domain-containing protein [Escherichia coli]ESK34810.1 hypothetical protein G966_02930 [Escherichia coli UMEA 3323-1]OWD89187.1 hypothetical protein A8M40_22715 [Escherichia coli]RCP01461.1 DUF551 domain-containing protein [Escherichia coli]HAH2690560.1 DUF551 domain-containing protein [Escherichia coli]HAI0783812.1 DUF551 domain-containing protein [Escherichia coli]